MKTKTEAAKILLEKGWTFEEVERVLGQEQIVINPLPTPIYPHPTAPSTDRMMPWMNVPYQPMEFWCQSEEGTTRNLVKVTVPRQNFNESSTGGHIVIGMSSKPKSSLKG